MRRLFVALEPDEATRALALEVALSLRIGLGAGVRVGWTAEARLHVTLAFLGDVAEPGDVAELGDAAALGGVGEANVAAASEVVAAVGRGHCAFVARAGGAGAFPSPDRARVLWLAFGRASEPLAALVHDLGTRLRGCGFALEERPFNGHITLARCRSPRGIDAREALQRAPGRTIESAVSSVVLMESVRDEAGPRYAVLARAPLARPG